MSGGDPARLALHALWAELGARFEERAGFLLPASFGDPEGEYRAVREGAALFEQSHRSRILVTGTDAGVVLDGALGGHVGELDEGQAQRAAVLDANGRIADLALVARTGGIAYQVMGEPARNEATLERLHAAVEAAYDVRIEDRTEMTCQLALAGPEAPRLVQEHLSDRLPPRLPAMYATLFEFERYRTLIVRESDTGEEGFTFVLAEAAARALVARLVEAGATPAGTLAHDVARVEACIPAYEPDLSGGLTPSEAGLAALLKLEGTPGRLQLVALVIEGMDPEHPAGPGLPVLQRGVSAGEVRSCVASPVAGGGAALAVVRNEAAEPGTEVTVGGLGATVVTKPLFRRRR